MSAILREDPPDLSVTNQSISPALERVVRHCLEKNPEQRFQSARDIAFNLEALSGASGPSGMGVTPARRRRFPWLALAGAALALLLALAFWVGRKSGVAAANNRAAAIPVHSRLTFQRGNVLYARFTGDGQTVVYSAAWGDHPAEIFLARVGSPESRPLGISNANLLSISSAGELAILLKKTDLFGTVGTGTLARVPLAGGTPRQILDDVEGADWAPDGKDLAVLHQVAGTQVLEFPIGKKLFASAGGLEQPRVSPDGNTVAVVDHGDEAVDVFDRTGNRKVLTHGWILVDSLAWHPSGREIWFAAVSAEGVGAVYAVDLSGHTRTVAPMTDLEAMHDIAKNGTVLVEREINVREILFGSADGKQEHNLSWFDQSSLACLSDDGKTLLFDEEGEGGGPRGSVYLRTTDGASPVRLGDGAADHLSPDGKWALTRSFTKEGPQLVLLPTATGQARPIPLGGFRVVAGEFLPPDGKRLLVGASETGHGVRAYVMDLAGGKPRAVTEEGLSSAPAPSPDGSRIAANGTDGRPMIFPVDGGQAQAIPGLETNDIPLRWSSDGGTLYVTRRGEIPKPVYRYSFSTGKKTLWRQIVPADRTGLIRIENLYITPDGMYYAYSVNRITNSDLFVVTGWK
jgi:eukaryotic-like serine/threonine-protein kinase